MEAVVRQADLKRKSVALEDSRDDETMDELLGKYEDVAVRCIKLEHELSDSNRRMTLMESLVKKANEERDVAKDSLKKIQLMPELEEVRGRRARSISPGQEVFL
ncbi:unnamed protein product [Gongylonema pulchrum]|uniref:SKA2 domain-containing protein n=1 Tax=Gongylonema pulchrum TaxID=637853 RepID=A0A183DFL5_9BILA|nr:unnamed protein product [Gongylonema pulchrum]VDN35099.1 unnamed protein product [Gongylonema pulchrum]